MFGADYAKGPLVAGLSLSHSRGLGEYTGVAGGQVAVARLPVEREGRARQHVPAAEAHLEQPATPEPAIRPHPGGRRATGNAQRTIGLMPANVRAAGEPRRPEGPARHRRVDAGPGRIHAREAAQAAQEVEGHSAPHPRPQIPARELAPEARLARRRWCRRRGCPAA